MGKKKLPEDCETLKELFNLWKEEQSREKTALLAGSENTGVKESLFLYDGPIDCQSDKAEILFVCRESHIDDSNVSDRRFFWIRETVLEERHNRYYNLMLKCLKELGKDESKLRSCAYMNINKRGGGSRCDLLRLDNYAEYYHDFIFREIEIISPKIIIMLGKFREGGATESIIKDYVYAKRGAKLWLYPRHPSVYWKKVNMQRLI